MPSKRKRTQTEIHIDDIFGANDEEVSRGAERRKAWRADVPTRKPTNVSLEYKDFARPTPCEQQAWTYYTHPVSRQSWVTPPFLVPMTNTTQSLTGAPAKAKLMEVTRNGEKMQHYTNIHRIQHLAERHPLVSFVGTHKVHKAADPSRFNKEGRCTKFHQSPWDLAITLGASGAVMHVGATVNNTNAMLLSLWWKPVHKRDWTPGMEKIAESIFLDITEVDHTDPDVHTGLLAWVGLSDINAAPGAVAQPTSSSSSSATRIAPSSTQDPHAPAASSVESIAASGRKDERMDAASPASGAEAAPVPAALASDSGLPESKISEQIQKVILNDEQDDITENAIAASAVQPDQIVNDCNAADKDSPAEPIATTGVKDEQMPAASSAESIAASGAEAAPVPAAPPGLTPGSTPVLAPTTTPEPAPASQALPDAALAPTEQKEGQDIGVNLDEAEPAPASQASPDAAPAPTEPKESRDIGVNLDEDYEDYCLFFSRLFVLFCLLFFSSGGRLLEFKKIYVLLVL